MLYAKCSMVANNMAKWLEQNWFKKVNVLTLLLLPLTLLFLGISTLRRQLYRVKVFRAYQAPVPVLVVGNISVGGNGKTPFVLWLVPLLQQLGFKVAVISRGYGANPPVTPFLVTADTVTEQGGDEPCLLAQRLRCPVMIGADRQASIKKLLAEHDVNIIVCDDGLQHYQLARDIEFCIIDNQRQFGNGLVLPAGPLREPIKRTQQVDLAIYNGGTEPLSYSLEGQGFYRVKDGKPADKVAMTGVSVCAIGNPARFESSLEQNGITLTERLHFADHYAYQADDFEPLGEEAIFMTEKDAVKCKSFAKDNWYYLKVDAKPTPALYDAVVNLLKEKEIRHGL